MADIAQLGLRIRADGAREATNQLDRLSASATRTEAAAQAMGRNVRTAGQGFSSLGPSVQNASYQIQDFAVQVAAGTSATVAFSQQVPQLLGGLGMWGAAIGAVVAVGAGLAPMLFRTSDSAEDAAEGVERFADALAAYRDYADTAMRSTDELRGEFGDFADEVQANAQYLAQVVASRAIASLDTSAFMAGLQDATDAIEHFRQRQEAALDNPRAFNNAEFRNIERAAEDAAAALGLSIEETERLGKSLAAVADADSMIGVRDAAHEALGSLRAMTREAEVLPQPVADLVQRLDEVVATTAAAAVTMGDVERATGSARDKALELLGSLREEVREREAINGYMAEGMSLAEARLQNERDIFAAQVEQMGVAADLADELMRAWDAAKGVGDAAAGIDFSWAAAQAADLASQIERTVSATMALAEQGRRARRESQIRLEHAGDPVGTAGALAAARADISGLDPILQAGLEDERAQIIADAEAAARNRQRLTEIERAASARSRKGRSGGGKSEAQREAERIQRDRENEASRVMRDVERSALDAMTATERFSAELADLHDLYSGGYLSASEYGLAVDMLKDKMQAEQFEPFRRAIEDISDSMAEAIVNGENMGDALGNMFKRLASDLISSGLTELMSQAFGAFMGSRSPGAQSGSAIAGALSSAIAGARAGGGPVQAGLPYLVNEGTPRSEIMVPSQSGGVLNVRQAQEALRGSGGGEMTFAPTYQIDARGSQMSEAQFRAILEDNNRRVKGDIQKQLKHGPKAWAGL